MTKDDIHDLINDTHAATGCGCCGNYEQVSKDVKEAVEEIWKAMGVLLRKRQAVEMKLFNLRERLDKAIFCD